MALFKNALLASLITLSVALPYDGSSSMSIIERDNSTLHVQVELGSNSVSWSWYLCLILLWIYFGSQAHSLTLGTKTIALSYRSLYNHLVPLLVATLDPPRASRSWLRALASPLTELPLLKWAALSTATTMCYNYFWIRSIPRCFSQSSAQLFRHKSAPTTPNHQIHRSVRVLALLSVAIMSNCKYFGIYD